MIQIIARCDRCGHEAPTLEGELPDQWIHLIIQGDQYVLIEQLDFCGTCVESFTFWQNSKEVS